MAQIRRGTQSPSTIDRAMNLGQMGQSIYKGIAGGGAGTAGISAAGAGGTGGVAGAGGVSGGGAFGAGTAAGTAGTAGAEAAAVNAAAASGGATAAGGGAATTGGAAAGGGIASAMPWVAAVMAAKGLTNSDENTPKSQPISAPDAMSRRMSAMQEDPMAQIQQGLMALSNIPDDAARKEAAGPLVQAYFQARKGQGQA